MRFGDESTVHGDAVGLGDFVAGRGCAAVDCDAPLRDHVIHRAPRRHAQTGEVFLHALRRAWH